MSKELENQKLNYATQGDYCLPCIRTKEQTELHIGVWANRHRQYAVFVLYCCGNGNCSGAAAQAFNLIQTVSRIAEIHFAVMGCYIYVFRIEFSQQFYGVVYGVESLTFQRRKHLKRKRCGFVVF